MNKTKFIHELIISTIPQFYQAEFGKFEWLLEHNATITKFCSHRNLTPHLWGLMNFVDVRIPTWVGELPEILTPMDTAKIQKEMAKFWLGITASFVNWEKALAYVDWVRIRTFENHPVSLNLVFSDQEIQSTTIDITNTDFQKVIDPLASSPNVYFQVNGDLKFSSYEEISWLSTKEPADYKFHPDFVQPFHSILQAGWVSLHITSRGDLLIQNKSGIIAANRKGRWYLYEATTTKNSLTDILENYRVGCNLFDLVFDLSYRRHGALLIFDPNHNVINHIVNKNSILDETLGCPDEVRKALSPYVGSIQMKAQAYAERRKKLLIEIAGMDGAVVFDEDRILAFGAMIETHPTAGGMTGARSTAAKSAYLWGGTPVKISSDGDISILFLSKNDSGKSSSSELTFM